MKTFGGFKHIACATIAAATVISVGCIAMADEIATEDLPADQIESGETVTDTETEAVIAEETEEVTAEEQQEVPETEIIDEVVAEDEEIIEESAEDIEADSDYVVYEVEETVVSEDASYGVPNGWEAKNGKWYYYVDGNPLKGWNQIGSEWYYFFGDGEMMVGGLYDGAEYKAFFIFDYKGHMCTNGWKQLNGSWFYCGANGKCVTGWNKIDGKWYYFDKSQDPYMYTGPQLIDGKCYLFGSDGSLQTGWYNYYAQWYYADSDGICATGWKQIDGKWYYFYEPDYSSPFMFGGGLYRIGENWYGFDDNGVMLTGWYNDYVIEEDGETLYLGEWYYLDKSNGQAKKGWAQIGNKWYYFQASASYDPPYALSGINIIEGKYYYFDEDTNVMASDGWVKKAKTYGTNAVWFYADKKGALATGWQKIGNDWYYFGDGTYYPYMHRGIVDVDGDDYYLGTNGKLVTGWFREVDKYSGYVYPEYHYADKNGVIAYNKWLTIDGKTYYIDSNGDMVTGMMFIYGIMFEFDDNGVCLNPGVG